MNGVRDLFADERVNYPVARISPPFGSLIAFAYASACEMGNTIPQLRPPQNPKRTIAKEDLNRFCLNFRRYKSAVMSAVFCIAISLHIDNCDWWWVGYNRF